MSGSASSPRRAAHRRSVPPNGQASFIAHASNGVLFIQWDRSNSSISGSLENTLLSTPSGDGTTTDSEPFTGTISGDGLTIDVTPSGGSAATYVGKVNSTGFSLDYPGAQTALITLDFSEADASAYDSAVTNLADSEYTSPCSIYVQGHNARLTISGPDAASDCATFVQAYTTQDGDAPWTTTPQADPGDLRDVCSLTDLSGEDMAVVEDDGGQVYGSQACQVLRGESWTTAAGEPSQTSSAQDQAGPTAPPPTTAPDTVRVVSCPTEFAIPSERRTPPSNLRVLHDPASTTGLVAYTNSELFLVGPSGMQCSGVLAVDGGTDLVVWPKGDPQPGQHSRTPGLSLLLDPACAGCRAHDACPFFPKFAASLSFPCSPASAPAGERVYMLSSSATAFEDPAGVPGDGWPSGGPDPANGIVGINPRENSSVYRSTCTLPAAEHAICTVSLNDVFNRYGDNGATAPAASVLIAGSWTGTRPTEIDFSADAGNIVTGISWSSWTATRAVGHGTSGIQNCIPDCAQGTTRLVPTTLALSVPSSGHFTQIIETRDGGTETFRYPEPWALGAS